MGRQISLGSIKDLADRNEFSELFSYFGNGLEINLFIGSAKLYDKGDRERMKQNIYAVKEFLGSKYHVNPEITIRDADEDGNIQSVNYSVRVERR